MTGRARVTAHVFGEDALPGLIAAGIDCIEHGTGLTDDTVAMMVEHGTVLVPTHDQHRELSRIRRRRKQIPRPTPPTCASCMPAARNGSPPPARAGVPIYAGTDAGNNIVHGRIADEVDALKTIGMTATDALGAACWDARHWLGRPA